MMMGPGSYTPAQGAAGVGAPGLNFSNKPLGLKEGVEHYLIFTNPAVGHQVDMRLRPSGGVVVAPPSAAGQGASRGRAQAGAAANEKQGQFGGSVARGLGAFAKGAGFGIQMMVRTSDHQRAHDTNKEAMGERTRHRICFPGTRSGCLR